MSESESDSSWAEECGSQSAEAVHHGEWLGVAVDELNSASTPPLYTDDNYQQQQQRQQSAAREFLCNCDMDSQVTPEASSELKQSTKTANNKLRLLLQFTIAGHYDESFRTDAVAQCVSDWNAQYASDLVWKLDCLMYWFDQGYISSDDRQEYAIQAWELFANDN
jgi:hypothetical protein